MRNLTHRESDEVAGGAPPNTVFVLTPEKAPFSIAVPTPGPSHENSPHLAFGMTPRRENPVLTDSLDSPHGLRRVLVSAFVGEANAAAQARSCTPTCAPYASAKEATP